MTHAPTLTLPADSRVNEFIVGLLFTSILVLAGIISIAQFAYY